MTDPSKLHLMVQAARLYYEQDHTQEEVARILELSRPKVSRLLQRARREGIVQVRVNDPTLTQSTLEQVMTKAFQLRDARIAVSSRGDEHLTRQHIGWVGARYLEEILIDGQKVGVGWGRTLRAAIAALSPSRQAEISVVPMLGGLTKIAPAFQVHELARMLAESFQGVWQPFYAPAIVKDEAVWSFFIQSDDLGHITNEWDELDVAVVGIGNVDFDVEMEMLFAEYLDQAAQNRLRDANAVGDLCVRFFDIEGHPCRRAMEYVVGIELEQLRAVPRVIGIAGGAAKAEALLGALRGGYLDVVITDEAAALGALQADGHDIPPPQGAENSCGS